ncbi:hypothetical protein HY212_04890 [Candidatus Pacearchaeota archaeon]|nr:hypothetical protein [Candidatus Pacearchaeota archaeon]
MSNYISSPCRVRHYLLQNCHLCKQEMILEAGSIIYGDKWFHNKCFNTWKEFSVLAKGSDCVE